MTRSRAYSLLCAMFLVAAIGTCVLDARAPRPATGAR